MTPRPSDTLTVKGRRDSLLIIVAPEASLGQVLADLMARLDGTPDFFRGARVALDLGPRPLAAEDLEQVLMVLRRHEVTLLALLTTDAATRQLAQERGLATTLLTPAEGGRQVSRTTRPAEPTLGAEERCLVLKRTLRSGQVLQYQGHVIVVGDVNPGAEVMATGDVFVWGRLRGIVHAGAAGDRRAIVCALELAPAQLRIADLVARTPEGPVHPPRPELARVEAQRIIVETW